MKRFTQFGVWLGLLLLAVGFSLPAAAKGTAHKQPGQGNKGSAKPPNNSGNQTKPPANDQKNKNNNSTKENNEQKGTPAGNGRGGLALPPKFVEHLQDMSPEQQERFMKNNERFKNMSPERQAQIRQRLQHWNSLTPEQRTMWRQREEALEQMSPQEQQFVRQQVMPAWRDMVPAQRRFMQQHLNQLYGLSTPEARAKLSDPAFLQGMSPEQQRMLPYLYRLRVGAAPEPPPGPPES
ncbi:MAG: DUF3106 domain-containing protein [Candidatus Acidiferrales bacterium]